VDTVAVEEFFSRADRSAGPDGCWPWKGAKNEDGYGQIKIRGEQVGAHRRAWELARGPIPKCADRKRRKMVLHNCPGGDLPACVNPSHLWLGTHAENMADRSAKQRQPVGSMHPNSKLTEAQVVELRALAPTTRAKALARRFGISDVQVRNIASGRQRERC
jgi:hypothetical protein